MKQARAKNEIGFTLIEAMIVVAIIGILSMIVYPSYMTYLAQSRRSDALNALSYIANDLEKFYSECSAYTTNITATARSCTIPAGPPAGSLGRGATGNQSPNRYYVLTISMPPAAGVPTGGYLVTATAQGTQAAKDTACRTIMIDSTGTKTAKNSGGTVTTTSCWKK